VELNGGTQIALTKIDILFASAKGIREYGRLPKEASEFVSRIEQRIGVPVTLIGTGAEESDIIDRRNTSRLVPTGPTLLVKGKRLASVRD
jgi:adenylosuccinate synthase